MRLHRQYLQLLSHYEGTGGAETTLEELAGIWDCTVRNAALVVARMEEQGWIGWQARRGRSKRSALALFATEEEIAADLIGRAQSGRDILLALEQLAPLAPSGKLRSRLETELLSRFGFRRETAGRRKIDVLRLPIRQAPRTLDPLEMNLLTESFVGSHLYDSMVRLDKGALVPHLAHAWGSDGDARVWTFRLRKGVFFHHGKEMDGDDAVFTLERLREAPPGTLYRQLFRKIRRVDVRNERTVTVELESPLAFFPELLATGRAGVLPADLGRPDASRFRKRPVGTGPFKLAESDARMLVLEAFERYFRERAHLDRVEIWVMQEEEDEGFVGGGDGSLFRIIHNPRDPQCLESGWKRIGSDVTVSKFLTVNTRKAGYLSDPAKRAAVLDLLADDHGTAAQATDGPGGDHANPVTVMQRKPDGSASALAAVTSGETVPPAGEPLRLVTIQPYGNDAAAIAGRLGQFGIPVEVELVPPGGFTAEKRLKADLLFFSLIRDREALLRQYDLYLTMTGHLDEREASSIRAALSAVERMAGRHARERILADLENRLIRDRLLVIWQERSVRPAVHESVGGAAVDGMGWVDLRSVWFG